MLDYILKERNTSCQFQKKKNKYLLKKVLIITYYWPPSGGGGVQRWVKFVKYLKLFGVEPIILTIEPDSASFPIIDESLSREVPDDQLVFKTKSFEPLSFYRNLNPNKEIPFGGFANEKEPGLFQKLARFIRGNLFIPDARIGWNKYALIKACEIIEKYNIDTLITTSPPHSTQLVGRQLKRKYKLKWIADMRDPWTDIYYYNKMYHTPIASKIDSNYEISVLKESDSIIVVSEAIKRLFSQKTNNIGNKIHVIPNGYDESDFNEAKNRSGDTDTDKFRIVYTGTIADNYNIDGFLEAIEGVINSGIHNIKILFIGRVSDNYISLIESSKINRYCKFIGHVDHKASISYLTNADMLFLSIPDVPNNEGILTGKLFEYLASMKPILAVGPTHGDAAAIINNCDGGKVFKYDDKAEIKNYILSLYQRWGSGESEKDSIKHRQFSRENLTKKLSGIILSD